MGQGTGRRTLGAVTVKSFKAFTEKHLLKLDGAPGLIYVRGVNDAEPRLEANGSGKSTLWDAVTWCLYGRTVSGLKNTDVKPWSKTKEKTAVAVSLTIGSSKYRVERGASPNYLRLNGKDVGQEVIDRLIGLSYAAFTRTVVLGQGRPLFLDLTPREKMDLLAEVKDLDRWELRSEAASKKTALLEKERDIFERELTEYRAGLKQAEDTKADVDRRSKEWQDRADERHAASKADLKLAKEEHAALQKRADKANLEEDSAGTEVVACERQVGKLGAKLAEAEVKFAVREEAKSSLERQIRAAEKELASAKDKARCPTCGQALEGKNKTVHRQSLRNKIEDLTDKLRKLPLKAMVKDVMTLKKQLASEREALASFKKKEHEAHLAQKRCRQELADLAAKIKSMEAAPAQINPYLEQKAALLKKIKSIKLNISGAEDDLKSVNRDITHTKFWVKGFKDVRLYVIEELLHELTLHTLVALEELGLVGWEVSYEIEKISKSGNATPGLHVMISSPGSKRPVRWESWSGGEAQRLRLASALALSSVLLNHAGVSFNIEVLDEPTRALSGAGIEDLISALHERARKLERRIYYTDHRTLKGYRFSETITVVKDKAGSYIHEN